MVVTLLNELLEGTEILQWGALRNQIEQNRQRLFMWIIFPEVRETLQGTPFLQEFQASFFNIRDSATKEKLH